MRQLYGSEYKQRKEWRGEGTRYKFSPTEMQGDEPTEIQDASARSTTTTAKKNRLQIQNANEFQVRRW